MDLFHNKRFTITNNIIDKDEVDAPVLKDPLPNQTLKFRLLDDDKNIYFEGVMIPTDTEMLFYPLDTLGEGYGCTEIQIFNDKGEWETI